MNEVSLERTIRLKARQDWRDEARLDGYKAYPLGSLERNWYISESQKILFEDGESNEVNYGINR